MVAEPADPVRPGNPVVAAIEAGHVNHGTRCTGCRQDWPCEAIRTARRALAAGDRERRPVRHG